MMLSDMKPLVPRVVEDDLRNLRIVLDEWECARVLLVADRAAYEQSGARETMKALLTARTVDVLTDFEPNPEESDVLRAARTCREFAPDTLIAIGGGTAIDIAKLAAACSSSHDSSRAVLHGKAEPQSRGVPFIAVPTTAGTGSEATHFAVVYCDGAKHSIAHPSFVPDVAWLDAKLTYSLPPRMTAASGLDALCQAIESFWSVGATTDSRQWADEAIRLAWQNLPKAVHHPEPGSRTGMMRAAHLAGKAINVSKTTACHAMSYVLTSDYGVPHGTAAALTLAPVLERLAQVDDTTCQHPAGARHVRETVMQIAGMLGCKSAADAAHAIRLLVASLGCPTSLRDAGIRDRASIPALASRVNVARLANCPVQLSSTDIEDILQSVFDR